MAKAENPASQRYVVGKEELLLPANRDQIDLVPLIELLPKIESVFELVPPQLSTLQLNQLFSNAVHIRVNIQS